MNAGAKALLRPIARLLGITVREAPDLARLEALPEPVREELTSLYKGEAQLTKDGTRERMADDARIAVSEGMWLHDFCLEHGLASTLEIGLAYGFSTLYFIALLARQREGRHTAIDPYANGEWRGIGLAKVAPTMRKLGLDPARQFEFLEERSDHAAIDLRRRGSLFDLVFIDGNHKFDDVLVDFSLCDPLCREGGFVVFDDLWMRSVRTVVSFIAANRADYRRVPGAHPNVAAFRKVGPDARRWDHFAGFRVAGRSRTEIARDLIKKNAG